MLLVVAVVAVACEYDPAEYTSPDFNRCVGAVATHGFGYLAASPGLPPQFMPDPPEGAFHSATDGDDVIVIVGGPITVDAGDGDDLICVQGPLDGGPIEIDGGAGYDTVHVLNAADVNPFDVEQYLPLVEPTCPNLADAQLGLTANRYDYDTHLTTILDRPGSTGSVFDPADTRNARNDDSVFECTASDGLPLATNGQTYQTPNNLIFDSAQDATAANQRFGNFRSRCDFSHLSYDDPIVYPDDPGAAHLHMFFGNTHANAYSTYESLRNSGSSTCMGRELNRSSYWVPALFDAVGDVRIPDFMRVYYKNPVAGFPPNPNVEQFSAQTVPYPTTDSAGNPDGMKLVLPQEPEATVSTVWFCGNSGFTGSQNAFSATIPQCDDTVSTYRNDGVHDLVAVVSFPYCWSEATLTIDSLVYPPNHSEVRSCPTGTTRLPLLQFIVVWKDVDGTAGWRLSSDPVDTTTPGATLHADWFGAWHPTINQRWVDNCNNLGELDATEAAAGTYGVNCNDYLLGDGTRLALRDTSTAPGFEFIGDKIVSGAMLPGVCGAPVTMGGANCSG